MPVQTLSGVPSQITAGDTVRFTVSDGSRPSSGWSLVFLLSLPDGSNSVSTAGTADGGGFLITLSAAVTAALTPATYSYALRFTETASGDVETTTGGRLTVLPNPAVALTPSWARATLTLAEAGIKKIADKSNASVTINGQSFSKRNLDELMKFRDSLRSKVDSEEAALDMAHGRSRSRGIGVRFIR